MEKNELVLRSNKELVLRSEKELSLIYKDYFKPQAVSYSLIDSCRYSFEYVLQDDISVKIYESDRMFDENDIIDFELEDEKEESNKSYYLVAATSGILTGAFSCINLPEEKLKMIKQWGDADWEKTIIRVAKMIGFKNDDVKAAIKFIRERLVPCYKEGLSQEVKDSIKAHLNYLSSHPTLAGLMFSIFTQFGELKYSFDENGIKAEKIPEYYAIGHDFAEKIFNGFLYWIFDLAVDIVISERKILDEMKIPKELGLLLKGICKTKVFSRIPKSYEECEKKYSEWIKKSVNKSKFKDEDGEVKEFKLIDIIKKSIKKLPKDNIPVVLNECIVRTFYFVKKLNEEIITKEINSFDDFDKIDVENILPINNRVLSRMLLISTGCFSAVNTMGAVIKSLKGQVVNGRDFKTVFISEINIIGVGRFVGAIIADSKYWADDVKVFLHRKDKSKEDNQEADAIMEDIDSVDTSEYFTLTAGQMRLLYSLEYIAINKDIEHTESDEDKTKKEEWRDLWVDSITANIEIKPEEYFVDDEKSIYDYINSIEQDEENLRWFYLLAMELIVYKPYHSLGNEKDKEFKKLSRTKYNYIDDQFDRRQTIINRTEIDSIREKYKDYKNIISGKTKKTIFAVGAAAAAAAATGGLAYVFAPGIATMIAGEAVVGLHGAALTSASLAFVGGGSLAAGGLGMAGGTAIITGGGILLGLAGGSGGASIVTLLSQTNSEFWLRQTVKYLVFCKCVLKDKFDNTPAVKSLMAEVEKAIKKMEKDTKELEKMDCSLDKDVIKKAKESQKYLLKCKSEMSKIIE